MLRIFTAPISEPDKRTLQADAATWQALVEQLPAKDKRNAEIIAAVRGASGDKAKRVTLSDDLAKYVLNVAGVSG